jgi:hypothetical protein
MLFVTTQRAIDRMLGKQIQAIFHQQHILLPATWAPDAVFDATGLFTLGCLTTEREVVSMQMIIFLAIALLIRLLVDSNDKKLHRGTLLDLLTTDEDGNQRVLHIIDIPMGSAPIPTPPGYR